MQDIRVAIIEDDHEIRELMQIIIEGSPGFTCPYSFESCESAIENIKLKDIDILLMDIDLPGMNGVEGVQKIKSLDSDISILMLTIHEESEYVFDSLCAGANGYILKGTPPVKLLGFIQDAFQGGAPMSASIAQKVVRYFHRSNDSGLSDRELEILQLLCDGQNYISIGKALFISKNTVKGHIKSIYRKLHVHNRAEAVKKAIKDKLIR